MAFFSATILIQSSDQANGIVSFESAEDVILIEPNGVNPADNVKDIPVIREPGIFGVVKVPFTVTTLDGRGNVTDVTPSSGFITFKDKEVSPFSFPLHFRKQLMPFP